MIDPVFLSIGTLQIKWYGLLMAIAYLIGFLIVRQIGKYRGISKKDIEDFFVYLIIAAILGGRILHVIQNWSVYSSNLLNVFAVWNGGLSFHGGFFAVVLICWWFCKKRHIHFYDLADIFVVPLGLGLFLGRIGNFINQEHFGTLTSLPWGIQFDVVEGIRHPTQLYEALTHLITFFITFGIFKLRTLRRGVVFWSFVTIYSIFRFFTDFLRDQGTWLAGMTMAQWISIILGIMAFYMCYRFTKHL